MSNLILNILFYPFSLRRKLLISLLKRVPFLSYPTRVKYEAVDRPYYAYPLWHAARLAKGLGHDSVSVIEFGVAWGRGLLCLERHAREVEKHLGIRVEVYGFDTGEGLPPPENYRDIPYYWTESMFKMDRAALERRLTKAKLVFGNVSETVAQFAKDHNPAPIGAVIIDLDYYSSTRDAFRLMDFCRERMLPRAYFFFDDIIGDDTVLMNPYVGEELAVNEFNQTHPHQKITEVRYLTRGPGVDIWRQQMYAYHDFAHPDYTRVPAAVK